METSERPVLAGISVGERAPDAGERGRSSPPEIRALVARAAVLAITIAALVLTALLWSVTRLRAAADAIDRDSAAAAITSEIELRALDYRRLADLEVISGEGGPDAAARARARHEIRALFTRADQLLSSPTQRDLLERASDHLDAYFDQRERSEDGGADVGAIARDTRTSLELALDDLRTLHASAVAAVDATREQNAKIARLAEAIGGFTAVLLLVGLAASGGALQRIVSRPLRALHQAIVRFRDGDSDARAPVEGPRELSQVADAFNGMADTLGRQRRDELVLLAGVVHDLRNPLAGLKLGLHALRSEQLTTATRTRTIDLLDRQVDRLSQIVGDVLDATRMEVGPLDLRREVFDVTRSVREIVDVIAPTSEIHRIVVDLPDEPVMIDGDPVRIERVIGNLLSNAIKYSPGGGQIDVRVARGVGEMILEVTDRGIGIASDAIQEIFAPFRRRAPEVAGGAGLGLSVVRRMVQVHGGSIEVESTLGRGSTFRVRLPLAPLTARVEGERA